MDLVFSHYLEGHPILYGGNGVALPPFSPDTHGSSLGTETDTGAKTGSKIGVETGEKADGKTGGDSGEGNGMRIP